MPLAIVSGDLREGGELFPLKDIAALLIQEPPLQVLPSLAVKIGLNEAIVLQQLWYLLRNPKFGKRIDEKQWIFNTVDQWRADFFPFWSGPTIKRIFASLKRQELIETCQPEGRISRRQYYRIASEKLAEISDEIKLIPSMGSKRSDGNGSNCALPNTKTTSIDYGTKKSEESKETSPHSSVDADEVFDPLWKPKDHGTKKEQLKHIKTPKSIPSEREFNAFIENEPLNEIGMGKGGDLYHRLTMDKWHQWLNDRWHPIRNWKLYVAALDSKMAGATDGTDF